MSCLLAGLSSATVCYAIPCYAVLFYAVLCCILHMLNVWYLDPVYVLYAVQEKKGRRRRRRRRKGGQRSAARQGYSQDVISFKYTYIHIYIRCFFSTFICTPRYQTLAHPRHEVRGSEPFRQQRRLRMVPSLLSSLKDRSSGTFSLVILVVKVVMVLAVKRGGRGSLACEESGG
jgi:hypothetical protein